MEIITTYLFQRVTYLFLDVIPTVFLVLCLFTKLGTGVVEEDVMIT